jgi:hypothetical protein
MSIRNTKFMLLHIINSWYEQEEREVKIIGFHKSTDEVLRAINGHLFNMHNQPLTVIHLKIIMALIRFILNLSNIRT